MSHLVFAILAWTFCLVLDRKRFRALWPAGFAGVAIMTPVDYAAIQLHLYHYPGGIIYLGGIPLFLFFGIYAASVLYLYWLPRRWRDRFLYTLYIAVLYLAVEAMVYSLGGIAYPNWRLEYSYLLLVAGLNLLAVFYHLAARPLRAQNR